MPLLEGRPYLQIENIASMNIALVLQIFLLQHFSTAEQFLVETKDERAQLAETKDERADLV